MFIRRQYQALIIPLLLSLFSLYSIGLARALPADSAAKEVGHSQGATFIPVTGTEDVTPSTAVPQKARDLLKLLQERGGTALPGYVGEREFQNRERLLPRGRYREYDVNPKLRGRMRDAERIVIAQQTGKAFYTGDHYRTFIPIN